MSCLLMIRAQKAFPIMLPHPVQVDNCAGLGVFELSQFHTGLALEALQTAEVKVTARAAANLLCPSTPNSAYFSTYG